MSYKIRNLGGVFQNKTPPMQQSDWSECYNHGTRTKRVAELALKQAVLIEEEHVECRPERITDAIIDENVDVHLIRKYFTYTAWLLVGQVLKRKQKKMTWVCNICNQDLHAKTSGPSFICESCLLWFHFAYVGLSKQPKTKNWFCRSCYAASKSDPKL